MRALPARASLRALDFLVTDLRLRVEPPGVAWITLDRPARRNAVTLAMWRGLRELAGRLGDDGAVRVVVLAGAGDHFCAGADIGEFGATRSDAAQVEAYERDVDACTEALAGLPKPTIAAVRGYCLGGGCALAMACDVRIAHASGRLGIPAARLGVVYGVPDTRHLLALVGLARAKRLLFGGHQIDAAEAARIGLVDEVVEGDLEEAVRRLAGELAENAPLSIAGAKLILTALATGDVDKRAPEIGAALRRSAGSEDYREGVRAFLEKRRAVFTGR